jgi:hypothetical protein
MSKMKLFLDHLADSSDLPTNAKFIWSTHKCKVLKMLKMKLFLDHLADSSDLPLNVKVTLNVKDM